MAIKKAELEKYVFELGEFVETQNKQIVELKKRVKTLEIDFKKVINGTRIRCIQPHCDSFNVEFIGYENLLGFDTANKTYKCRDCGCEWAEKK